jgi:NADPH:quinone reductase-like Zn-dependent oxidoreductase
MADTTLPSTMRVWKYASAKGGLEKNLTLYTSDPLPKPGPNQHLIKVLVVGLNPVDFKPAEAPFLVASP